MVTDYDGIRGVGIRVTIKVHPVSQEAIIEATDIEAVSHDISTAVTVALEDVIAGEWIAEVAVARMLGGS